MVKPGPKGERSALWEELRKLAEDLGVERPDLRQLISKDLPELQAYLGALPADRDRLRGKVTAFLESHIAHLRSPRSEDTANFQNAARISYNIYDNDIVKAINGLDKRRSWADKLPGKSRIAYDTHRNWWPSIVSQIEQRLLDIGEGTTAYEDPHQRSASRRLPLLVTVACLVVAAAVVIPLTLAAPHHKTQAGKSTPSSKPTSSIQPVAIESVISEEDDAGSSYVFLQKLQLNIAKLDSFYKGFSWVAYNNWVVDHSGVIASENTLSILLRGNAAQPVVIVGMQVIKHCQAPLTGTLLWAPSEGANNNIEIGFNLDTPFPIPQEFSVDGQLVGNYFANHNISLRPGETQGITIQMQTKHQYCQFTPQLLIDDGSKHVVESITNHGKPFGVTSVFESLHGPPFAAYQALYVDSIVAGPPTTGYVEENPATAKFHGGYLRS